MNKQSHEVTVIQYLMPDGHKTKQYTSVGDYYATIVDNLGITLSAEMLRTGQITVYGKLPEMDEEDEICYTCENGPDVQKNIKRIIKELEQLV